MSSILKDYKDLCIKPQWSWLKEVWKDDYKGEDYGRIAFCLFVVTCILADIVVFGIILYKIIIHDFIMDHLRVFKKQRES